MESNHLIPLWSDVYETLKVRISILWLFQLHGTSTILRPVVKELWALKTLPTHIEVKWPRGKSWQWHLALTGENKQNKRATMPYVQHRATMPWFQPKKQFCAVPWESSPGVTSVWASCCIAAIFSNTFFGLWRKVSTLCQAIPGYPSDGRRKPSVQKTFTEWVKMPDIRSCSVCWSFGL